MTDHARAEFSTGQPPSISERVGTQPCGRFIVPIAASMFTITDELGTVHHPKITVLRGGRVPARAPAGTPITLVMRATLPIGNGRVIYRPAGPHAVASWDFDSETD